MQTLGEHNARSLYKATYQSAALAFMIYVVLFLFIDRPVDIWLHACCAANLVNQIGEFFSSMASSTYIRPALSLALIAVLISNPGLERPWARALLYICISLAIAWCAGEGLKYLLGRYRPIMLFDENLYGFHYLSGKWEMNSTPSGHTLRAFAVCTSLSILFRRYMWFFIGLAVVIGLSRIVVTDHYPSDVVFGAFIGIFSALWTAALFFQVKRGPEGKDNGL